MSMMGHSLGGATTMRTTRNTLHILAGISLDAPVSHDTYDYDGDERTVDKLDSDIELDYGSDFEKLFLHIFAGKLVCELLSLHLNLKKDIAPRLPFQFFAIIAKMGQ